MTPEPSDPPVTAVESSDPPAPPGATVVKRPSTETFSYSPRPGTFFLYTEVDLDPAAGEHDRAMWVLGKMLRRRMLDDRQPISEIEFSELMSLPNFQTLTAIDWQEARGKVALAERLRAQARLERASDVTVDIADDEPPRAMRPDLTAGWRPNKHTPRIDVVVACGVAEPEVSRIVGRVWLAPVGPAVLIANARTSTWGVFGVGGGDGDGDGDDYRYAVLPEGPSEWLPCVFCGDPVTVERSTIDEYFAGLAGTRKLVIRHHPSDGQDSALG